MSVQKLSNSQIIHREMLERLEKMRLSGENLQISLLPVSISSTLKPALMQMFCLSGDTNVQENTAVSTHAPSAGNWTVVMGPLYFIVDTDSWRPDRRVVIPAELLWSLPPGEYVYLMHCNVNFRTSPRGHMHRPPCSLSDGEIYVTQTQVDLQMQKKYNQGGMATRLSCYVISVTG